MVDRLVIEQKRVGAPEFEEALLAAHADVLGIEVVGITRKPFTRGRFRPADGDVVAGSVKFVRDALAARGRQLPQQNPYPDELDAFLHRRVWKVESLGQALLNQTPVFVRPAKRWKLFTGFVAYSLSPAEVYGVSRREPVWCADVVTFRSEWRCYVVNRDVRFIGLTPHGGGRNYPIDHGVVRDAVAAYDGPSAYAIDFGVLDTGQTALIEANDGFSVGAYDDVPAEVYWDMTATRWKELSG